MTDGAVVLPLAWPIDLRLTALSHGWVELAPWQWRDGRLARRERIGARIGTVAITQRRLDAIEVASEEFEATVRPAILARVRRWLSADWQPGAAVATLAAEFAEEARLILKGGGRLLRGSFFYEDFVKTVLTINTNWAATVRMAAALVAEPGEGVFPAPAQILDYGEARLRERAKLGFRAATAIKATRRMLADRVIDEAGEGAAEGLDYAYLTGLPGIGPYAAAHCRLLLQDFARLPVDSVLTAYLRERFGCDAAAFAAARTDAGPYLALLYRLMRLRDKLAREAGGSVEVRPAAAVAMSAPGCSAHGLAS
jgi:3-methyladenine DNA glycosylase/8-oxoguanine DNA glycosylase